MRDRELSVIPVPEDELLKLLWERQHLRQQVHDLQNALTDNVMKERDVKVRFCHVNSDAIKPDYATDGSAGIDLYAVESVHIGVNCIAKVRTGLVFEVPVGYVMMMIEPRSSTAPNRGLLIVTGTIDSDYRGEVHMVAWNLSRSTVCVAVGDRIAQCVLLCRPRVQLEFVNELSETVRGEKGFGSTGE